ncbi:ATP-binding cassette domain-containing protein [Clostridium sp. CCUG 7971]|uniref:ABC transporter ATP-binding protein n=1 Tax=Clostridium sp. CCUG 7971 TaxID=2811414 RepID=UPI001ABBD771|nr:ATP-binding cassette domain-containing protein [Clostridium sp. CCUG 7971]MBO3444731.1 ATP-binding cassette domain-containing protein [Clostridium sp. CCUG 7971]
MLKIKSINKGFNKETINETSIFNNFNLEINKGDFITIVGSNGAGKSTLLNIISGALELDSGNIFLEEKDITNLKEHKKSRFISRVFQDPTKGTSPSMTILENLSLADNKGSSFGLSLGVNKKKIEKFKDPLSILNLGLEDKINTKVGMLSGGQRQALSLLMATLNTPKILLLDEHTAALDPKTSENIINLTNKIVKEKNITTIMITHNLNHAIEFGNRLLMMHRGEIILDIGRLEKKNLTKNDLIEEFNKITFKEELSDRIMFA